VPVTLCRGNCIPDASAIALVEALICGVRYKGRFYVGKRVQALFFVVLELFGVMTILSVASGF